MVIDVYTHVYWYITKKMAMFVNKKDSITIVMVVLLKTLSPFRK